MNSSFIIYNANIINEGKIFFGYVVVENGIITSVHDGSLPINLQSSSSGFELLDASNSFLMPGVIDDQVHFRDPGLTHKGDIYSESRAAVAGGITSFMDMPNTNPQTITNALLKEKQYLASQKSLANYSFYLGATNENIEEIKNVDPLTTPGVKVFMGASTGNMLVDEEASLEAIFRESPILVAIHSEAEAIIQKNSKEYRDKYGDDVPMEMHPLIRSAEACYVSTQRAVRIAKKYATRLHILHISTAKELELLDATPFSEQKNITSEVCVHHLWFDDRDYKALGSRIKWNPAIKSEADKAALLAGLNDGRIDVIATDHAPHTVEEKSNSYFKAPSGGPSIQHVLPLMFELAKQGKITHTQIVDKMCHTMARCFDVKNRGFIREGYSADLVILDPNRPWTISKENIISKCGWSPWEGQTLNTSVTHTFVNGHLVWHSGKFDESVMGKPLEFNRKGKL